MGRNTEVFFLLPKHHFHCNAVTAPSTSAFEQLGFCTETFKVQRRSDDDSPKTFLNPMTD